MDLALVALVNSKFGTLDTVLGPRPVFNSNNSFKLTVRSLKEDLSGRINEIETFR